MSADESTRYNVFKGKFEMRSKPEKIAGNRIRSRFFKQTEVVNLETSMANYRKQIFPAAEISHTSGFLWYLLVFGVE